MHFSFVKQPIVFEIRNHVLPISMVITGTLSDNKLIMIIVWTIITDKIEILDVQ